MAGQSPLPTFRESPIPNNSGFPLLPASLVIIFQGIAATFTPDTATTMKSLLLFLAILIPFCLSAQPVLLEPSHPAYDFLDRMETLGLLDHPLMGSRPVPRARVAVLLEEVYRKAVPAPGMTGTPASPLSRVDRETLAALRWEFSDAPDRTQPSPPALYPGGRSRWGQISDWMDRRGWFTGTFYRNGRNFYSWEGAGFQAYADPRGFARIIRPEEESDPLVITGVGVRLRGYVAGKAGLFFQFLDVTERGRGPYFSRDQLYEDRVGYVGNTDGGSSINYDRAEFDLALGGRWWEFHLAKLPLRWGPGRSGQLLLSDAGPSFHQAQFNLNLGSTLRLAYVFGSLKTFPELSDTLYTSAGYVRTIERSKYLAAHRLEWDPHPRLRLAFSEAVVFGERDPELAYLIPINFFYAAQHDLGDEDNTLLSFEATWVPLVRWKVYGQLLIDDITFGELGSDWYGNKQAGLLGTSWVEPAGLPNVDLALEGAWLRPFVYTHQYPANVYRHWTSPLGYEHPPNSETLLAQVRWRPHRRVALDLSGLRLRHGANTETVNTGGDILAPHVRGTPEEAPFLGGRLEETLSLESGITYEALEGLYLWSRGRWEESEGEDAWEAEIGFRLN